MGVCVLMLYSLWVVNSFDEKGVKMICEALKTNSTLTSLNLTGNEMKDTVFSSHLKWWKWTAVGFRVEGTRELCEGIKCNTALTELDISR